MTMIHPSSFLHENAIVEPGALIGENTRVWAFAHILPGATIGRECNICDHTFIENEVVIGDRVTVKCGVYLWNGIHLENDVFIGPNATFTNDRFPRSKQYPDEWPKTMIEEGASIGANATILPGVRVGRLAMVGAGAVVTSDVPPYAKVVGNPGRIIGYTNTTTQATENTPSPDVPVYRSRVDKVQFLHLPDIPDMRGSLTVAEYGKQLPFKPQRYFLVYDVPGTKVRGAHAHKECHQFLVCAKGQVSVVADDGREREEFILDRPSYGVYLPPMTWGIQYKYSSDAVLMVLASHPYDEDDYIRDYDEFIRVVKK